MQNWTPTTYGPYGSDRTFVADSVTKAYSLLHDARRAFERTYPHARDDGDQRRQDEYKRVQHEFFALGNRLLDELKHVYDAEGVRPEPGLVWTAEPKAQDED